MSMKTIKIFAAACMMVLAGCNSYKVRPLKYDPNLTEITVIENPRVIVSDFVDNIEDEFGARGIAVKVAGAGYVARSGEYTLSYEARQSWDFTNYLSDAKVNIRKNNVTVAHGRYHHNGGSASLSFFKWQGTATKMEPLYEELLEEWDKR